MYSSYFTFLFTFHLSICVDNGWANFDSRTPPRWCARELLHSMCERGPSRSGFRRLVGFAGRALVCGVLHHDLVMANNRL